MRAAALALCFFLPVPLLFGQAGKSKEKSTAPPSTTLPASPAVSSAPSEQGFPYARFRSSLTDLYFLRLQQQVNPFDIRPAAEDTIPKGDTGYRIQLLSTKNRESADSLFAVFRTWADTVHLGYQLYGYFEFRSPDYRIHVGDFYRLNEANALAVRMADFFPVAWVVHSKIIQDRSPFYQRFNVAGKDSTAVRKNSP